MVLHSLNLQHRLFKGFLPKQIISQKSFNQLSFLKFNTLVYTGSVSRNRALDPSYGESFSMNTLFKLLKRADVSFVAYVDDLLIIPNCQTRRNLVNSLNIALNIIFRWAIQRNIEISYQKSAASNLTKLKKLKAAPQCKIKNESLSSKNYISYLGMIIDHFYHSCNMQNQIGRTVFLYQRQCTKINP